MLSNQVISKKKKVETVSEKLTTAKKKQPIQSD